MRFISAFTSPQAWFALMERTARHRMTTETTVCSAVRIGPRNIQYDSNAVGRVFKVFSCPLHLNGMNWKIERNLKYWPIPGRFDVPPALECIATGFV